jgi:putative FmdB family regulatory protein
MPTYEYECSSCNNHFEVFQSMKDEALSECPSCKGAVRRLIGGGLGVIFKGSGFYSTDNKRSSASTGDSGKTHTKKEEKKEESPKPENKDSKKSA